MGFPRLQDPVAVQHSPEVSSCPVVSATTSLTTVPLDGLLFSFPLEQINHEVSAILLNVILSGSISTFLVGIGI